MRTTIVQGVLICLLSSAFGSLAQNGSAEIEKLKQRVTQLEAQVQQMSQLLEPIRAQQAGEARRKALREKFDSKMAQDRNKYTPDQLREAEELYQVANQKWGSPEAAESLQAMIKKYPDINRTGCALLYVAQRSQGDERTRYLEECMAKFGDCMYGDGVQVGAYARFLLAQDSMAKSDEQRAAQLYRELKLKYPEAVDHRGNLLLEGIKAEAK